MKSRLAIFVLFALTVTAFFWLVFQGHGQAFTPRRPFVPQAAASSITLPDPILWWRLDEGTGTNISDSADSHSAVYYPSGVTWVTGQYGPYALQFNGTSQYIENLGVPSFSGAPTNSGSFGWWGKPFTTWNAGSIRGIWGWHSGSTAEWDCQAFSNNKFYIGGVSVASVDTRLVVNLNSANWPQSNWCYYTFTYGSGGQFFYTNGNLCANNSYNSGTNLGGFVNELYLARLGVNTYYFKGQLDDFRIWNVTLTSNQVYYLYHTIYGQP